MWRESEVLTAQLLLERLLLAGLLAGPGVGRVVSVAVGGSPRISDARGVSGHPSWWWIAGSGRQTLKVTCHI